jgi:uncharacterized membrane protein
MTAHFWLYILSRVIVGVILYAFYRLVRRAFGR